MKEHRIIEKYTFQSLEFNHVICRGLEGCRICKHLLCVMESGYNSPILGIVSPIVVANNDPFSNLAEKSLVVMELPACLKITSQFIWDNSLPNYLGHFQGCDKVKKWEMNPLRINTF